MDDVEIEDVAVTLQAARTSIAKLNPLAASGVYAIYLNEGSALAAFAPVQHGLLYIGQSKDLAAREIEHHFGDKNTGFSTLRRSIGAILSGELGLSAHPRSKGASESNVRNYRFSEAGDQRLSGWMAEHLSVAVYPTADYAEIEPELIRLLKPVLNLKGWENPQRTEIKLLRKRCADQARACRG